MRLLLDVAYVIVAILASPWILYRLIAAGDWRGFSARLGAQLGARPASPCIWLHGASVGEVTLLRPLVELLENDLPDTPLVISTFTATGLAAARRSYPGHRSMLFPLDLSPVVERFLRHLDPRLVVIVESEFWPNFLAAARRRKVPVAMLNGKMSAKTLRIHARLGLLRRVLRDVSLIAVQTEEHAERLASLGVARGRLEVTGNMKYDLTQPPSEAGQAPVLRGALGYSADDLVIIGGSLHEREDEVLLAAFDELAASRPELAPQLSLIIVPRYPAEAARVERHVQERGRRTARKSAMDGGRASPPGRAGVLIIDTVGELGKLYGAADIAFVGGSLFFRASNKGGHNLMEPAILGVPVVFGPYNFSFKDTAAELLAARAGLMVHDAHELARALEQLSADPSVRRAMGERARRVVLENQGATRRNYRLLKELLSGDRLPASAAHRTMPRSTRDAESS